jgi:hypothetical protein
MEDKKLELLKDALKTYKDKWELERDSLPNFAENVRMHVKLTSMIYMAQWIINSINGGLDKPHGTNICNILNKNRN